MTNDSPHIVDLTDRQIEVIRALVEADGHPQDAGIALRCTRANVARVMGIAGLTGYDRTTRLQKARDILDRVDFTRTVERRRVDPERPSVGAACHPDRQIFQLRLCRECYRDRFLRSHETPVKPLDPELDEIRRQLEGVSKKSWSVLARGDNEGEPLTNAQMDTMLLAARGMSQKDIAEELEISIQTVKNHFSAAYARLGVTHLSAAFVKLGWLSSDPTRHVVLTPLHAELRRLAAAIVGAIDVIEALGE